MTYKDNIKTLEIKGDISNDCKTILPTEHFYSRSETRFVAKLFIDDMPVQLGCGWVPKDAIKVEMQDMVIDAGCWQLFHEECISDEVIIEIRAGTGGDEAALFVGDCVRMYTNYAATKDWTIEVLSTTESDDSTLLCCPVVWSTPRGFILAIN